MGTKPRTPHHFPRMKFRARKRDETREARESCQIGCSVVLVGADGSVWQLRGAPEVTE